MRSPKFHLREKELQEVFSTQNLKRVWRDKIRIAIKSSYIQDPIEALDFHIGLEANCLRIRTAVCDGSYKPLSRKRLLIEKSKGLCRQVVIPNIDDAIVLQVLSDALYAIIKDKASTKNSFFAPDDHRFSQVFKSAQGAQRYGGLRAWMDFQKAILGFAKTREYVAITDIANYYDFISYAHLRNTIVRLGITSEAALDMLIFTLAGMLWQPDYMPRVELGLPQMNLDAPRMLAHCFLYELDEYIAQVGKYDFARFMDDMDIGSDLLMRQALDHGALRSIRRLHAGNESIHGSHPLGSMLFRLSASYGKRPKQRTCAGAEPRVLGQPRPRSATRTARDGTRVGTSISFA